MRCVMTAGDGADNNKKVLNANIETGSFRLTLKGLW